MYEELAESSNAADSRRGDDGDPALAAEYEFDDSDGPMYAPPPLLTK